MNIFKNLLSGNTLFYPGCLSKYAAPELVERYGKILKLEGIDFVTLKDKEFCCGSPLKNAGAKDVFEDLARKNLKTFKAHGIDRVISNCPSCVAMFQIDYPKILGKKWDIKAQHVVKVMDKSLVKLIKNKKSIKATYHDPCHLGRVLGIYEKPRQIIKRAGYDLVEMDLHGEFSFCCGGGGGVKANDGKLSTKIAGDRLGQAELVGANVLITACPMCYAHLKENSKGIKVLEMSQLFNV